MDIRYESDGDKDGIRKVNQAAFETAAEASLVDLLREKSRDIISLVAEKDGKIIGHILFSPVKLAAHPDLMLAGLAPMSVLPEWQNQGIGSDLVRKGLEECRQHHYGAVVVLGHPHYYPRFGFLPSTRFGIKSEYDVPEEVFMILELEPGYLENAEGIIKYHEVFSEI